MALQDASRNQQRKNESVSAASPSKPDVSFLMQRAAQNAPHEFNLKWQKSELDPEFALSICYAEGTEGEPTWRLTTDAENVSTELWSTTTENPDEIHLLILKSLAAPPPAPKADTTRPQSPLGESPSKDASAYRMLAHNEQFAGRYRVLQQIGHGGMGRVYQVVDIPNNRVIALKVLHPHLIEDEDAVRRFEREAKATIGLRHPNLLTVHDFGFSPEGLPFIAMEYLDGEVLQKLLQIDGPLEVRRFLTIFLQTCSALHHAHSNQVIHRDVKPGNIMLIKVDETSDLAKLIDFGIAKIVRPDGHSSQRLTQTGDVFGSPFYMSPEQCIGAELDARSDIYSLGCVMYEAISGVRPFEGENALVTMQMQVSNKLEPLAVVCPEIGVPPQIESVINRALEKNPDDRYQSAKELGMELERLLTVDQINLDNQWITNQTRSGTFYAQRPSKGLQERADLAKVVDLLKECELINGVEHRYAMQLIDSGAEVSKYLTGSAHISEHTLHSAIQCQKLLESGECKIEMAVIALHYCHRNGIMLREAFDQLGWRMSQ
jgi:hypothetical protein